MGDELREKIADAASNPKRVRTDAGEAESHDLGQMIEADKYLSGRSAVTQASNRKHRGLRFNTIIPPGAG